MDQNIDSKREAPGTAGAFRISFYCSELEKLLCHAEVVLFELVMWFGGLTGFSVEKWALCCYGRSVWRWALSHSVGEAPRRWVKTRVRAVALVYPTAVAMSLSELPLRSMVWAMPRRQSVR